MVSGSAIATLILFIVSIAFVIQPVSIPVSFPRFRIKRIPVNLLTAPIAIIFILWAAQCIGPEQIRNGIVGTDGVKPYNILILFFSLAYMAITLDITGILQAAAFWVTNKGGSNGWKIYLYFYLMLTFLSIVLGNDPVILSGTAFLVYYTNENKLEHIPWIMSEFAAANTASMVLFVGNPTNVVICEGFGINNAGFTGYLIFPFIACSFFSFLALGLQFHKQVPKKRVMPGLLDVRSVLVDPVGAIVGSLLLGSCLIVALIVSFTHVDVWKIMLPFAATKFLYDIAADHYRFINGKPILHPSMSKPVKRPSADTVTEGDPADEATLQELHRKRYPRTPDTSTQFNAGYESPRPMTPDKSPPTLPRTGTPFDKRKDTDSTLVSPESDGVAKQKSLSMLVPHESSIPTPDSPQRSSEFHRHEKSIRVHFPTLYIAFPRLPFALVPFAFSQFILIEALAHQGWIDIFSRWLVIATDRLMYPTVWVVGVLGVILCNLSGTNIGATILLTKVVRAAILSTPPGTDVNLDAFNRAAGISLAVASNIGAVSFTFSASLAGLLWRQILHQKGKPIKQTEFAKWNIAPLAVMTGVGLAVVCAEMAVLFRK